MADGKKFHLPHVPPLILWGAIAALLALGLLVTVIDLTRLPKAETVRATRQKQRLILDATTGQLLLADGSVAPEVKPAEIPAAEPAPAPQAADEAPAPAPVTNQVSAPAPVTNPAPAIVVSPASAPVTNPAPSPASEPTPVTPAPTLPPVTRKKAPVAAPSRTAPALNPTPVAVPAPSPAAEAPSPVNTAPAPTPAAAPAMPDPALPKGTPALRTTPISEALKEQPRTKDSLTPAPAPEITETVDGLSIPKRGDKDITASHLYAHPFKRQSDQVLISFVILNTGLDPQSIGLAMALPSEVTIAYSPYTKPDMAYSENVRAIGHEVWTMLPAMGEHYPSDDPGPFGIISKMPPEETARRVREVLAAIPGSVGLILPPDETITPHAEVIGAALGEISSRGLLLMGTNPNHTIEQMTTNAGLAAIIRRADLVLDPTPNESQIRSRLAGLLDAAKDKGEFIVVLSARPQSLQILSDWLEQTKLEAPFVLAPLSAIYETKDAAEPTVPAEGAPKETKPKPAPKPKPKPLPQDQYKTAPTGKDAKPAEAH